MIPTFVIRMLCAALLMTATAIRAQEPTVTTAAAKGSVAFCLYELPPDRDGKHRWVNLGLVQYLEFTRNELRIYYGGGGFGSGHEARLPVSNPAHLDEMLEKLRQAAANCR